MAKKLLKPTRPNVGLEVAYRNRLYALIEDMHESILYWLGAAYKRNEPLIALDALPSTELERAVRQMVKRWQGKFNNMADDLAVYFSKDVSKRTDAQLRSILRKGGISIQFKPTKAWKDVLNATVKQNVQLIKSIAQSHLGEVQGLVMRSVQTGGDLGTLTKQLQKRYSITKRRAALIARDQNNKATSALVRVRQQELGIKKAVWKHSHAGKEPRKTHWQNDGKEFDVAKGWFDPDPKVRKRIWPGELINCRCTSQAVIPGLSA